MGDASGRMSTPAVEQNRLRWALQLQVEELEPARYRVTGGARAHIVELREAGSRCDCLDSLYRPAVVCKHRLAVYLARQLAEPVRVALRDATAPK